jgi:hypothetical protein
LAPQNFHQGRAAGIGSGASCCSWLARSRWRHSTSSAWAMPKASRSPREAWARQLTARRTSSSSSMAASCAGVGTLELMAKGAELRFSRDAWG